MQGRLRASALVALLLPAALVAWVSGCFVWNHFHDGPYLLDAGWYSAIVHRAGVVPENPQVVGQGDVTSYFGIHVSPLVSIASLLSYVVRLDRVTWYAVFQAAIYAPVGLATALLARRLEPPRAGTIALTLLVSLAFAFNGQTIACLGYPHYEILLPGGVCLMLVGLATSRAALTWTGVALAIATREDGGFHAALVALAVLASDVLGRPFPVPRRHVVRVAAVALAGSVVAFAVQKTFFVGANLFRHEYIGEPAFAHLSAGELARRVRALFESATFIVLPFGATAAYAIVRRDARYMLGWAAELPWFALNLLAAQPLKASFEIYTGFPFVASMFWVGAYGAVAARREPVASALAPLGVVSLASTLGLQLAYPSSIAVLLAYAVPHPVDHGALEAFAETLRRDPNAHGRLWLDSGAATWTIESASATAWLQRERRDASFDDRDGYLFFQPREAPLAYLRFDTPYEDCGRLPRTALFLCVAEGRALPPPLVPTAPLLGAMSAHGSARRAGEGYVVGATPGPATALYGPYVDLDEGRYRATWRVKVLECAEGGPPAHVDVFAYRHLLGAAPVTSTGRIELTFDAPPPEPRSPVELRVWSGACAFEVEAISLRQLR